MLRAWLSFAFRFGIRPFCCFMKTFCVAALGAGLLALAGMGPACGQAAGPEAGLTAAVAAAQAQYNQSFYGHPQLFNGPEYVDYSRKYHQRTGHAYYPTAQPQAGSVYYNGHYFAGIPLLYDVVLDQVVLSPPNSPLTLRLLNENVGYFTIGDKRFVRLVADSAAGKVLRTGFYELLLDGPVQVLARRAKRLQEHVALRVVDAEFTTIDRLLLKKAGRYYPVRSKAALMHLFADRAKEVQEYAKSQQLSFNKAQLEASAVQLAQHYASLPPH